MTAKYFAILTNQGAARLANAAALGTKLNLTQMAVGDANGTLPTPDPAQTKLINQKRIAPLNLLTVDPANTSQIIAEQIIPENEGGFWIREIGLYDDDGILIAVANCPETYKPQLQEGSGRTQTIRMILIVSSTSAITLKIDPAVVLATRQYVDDKIIEVKGYADDLMKKHVEAANPHKQYPLIANALKEMVDAGLAGDVLKNLGIKSAALCDVGAGTNQIPDMGSFGILKNAIGYQYLPGGLILQWGKVGPTNAGQTTNVTFTITHPTATVAVMCTLDATARPTKGFGCSAIGVVRTGFGFHVAQDSDFNSNSGGFWFALGY
ncbi:phage tail protein [Escherichia coli]|uniref:phage tail protein n=1 Tax=Escherichia coli TaxID=562 RepID=UPI000BB67208|nr:phage tail protein [Escherichia coli]EFB2362637.1 phage tail protein [Escherichia coli]EFI4439290.1 phage tail protein [Escherichia coli]EHK3456010.1 phage tail protein [Escherichia coli]EHN5564255.1 phage tail protein [Escherichia coli]EIA9444403.1 phage tail protein [Escherichia coli]